MKFKELDNKMRVFETAADVCVLPGMYMVARLDGRGFTKLTKTGNFEVPFDVRFRDMMVDTTEALMNCGFEIVYAYTESDEISLLFGLRENLFNRKLRKLNSTLAGEASARFSLAMGEVATFDCRISQLPNANLVVDYFRWRNEDAARNALNSYCYWTLRKELSARAASNFLLHKSVSSKNELLFENGINFNEVPNWQKRGVGLYWEEYEKRAFNPVAKEEVVAQRRRVKREFELPMKEEYGEFVRAFTGEDHGK